MFSYLTNRSRGRTLKRTPFNHFELVPVALQGVFSYSRDESWEMGLK